MVKATKMSDRSCSTKLLQLSISTVHTESEVNYSSWQNEEKYSALGLVSLFSETAFQKQCIAIDEEFHAAQPA